MLTTPRDTPKASKACPPLERIKNRPEFLAVARDRSWAMPGLVLQARNRQDNGPARVGFTVTKRVGNAVTRNRVKRRLREVARLFLPLQAACGFDYVLIGRKSSLDRPFENLKSDLAQAVDKVHKGARRTKPGRRKESPDGQRYK